MPIEPLQAPYQYFGGKSHCAALAWERFGDVPNYVEPFFGSGAVLLARPHWPRIETVNDLDAYVANFWRAVAAAPDAVSEYLDWPVNESDLEARHKWLVTAARKREHAERMRDDPDYFDPKIAGWWCWGLCAWIGSGWCSGEWHGRGSDKNAGTGINILDEQRGGKRPHLSSGRGVHRQLPHLGDAGQGVHRQSVSLAEWMQALSARFRRVRVCCGDWKRVITPAVTLKHGLTAIFLDPPYADTAGRDPDIYSHDCEQVAHAVREWAIANGSNPMLRIALCGYEGEHVMPDHWECVHWKAHGGYGVQGMKKNGTEYVNKYRERIWFSPHCLKPNLFQ